MRPALAAVLLLVGLVGLVSSPASADPVYEPFCIENRPSVGPWVVVCTPG